MRLLSLTASPSFTITSVSVHSTQHSIHIHTTNSVRRPINTQLSIYFSFIHRYRNNEVWNYVRSNDIQFTVRPMQAEDNCSTEDIV